MCCLVNVYAYHSGVVQTNLDQIMIMYSISMILYVYNVTVCDY